MTTTKKLTIAVVALAVALVCVVSGTLAFLVAQSNTVTNTFTYGKIELELAEEEKTNTTGMEFTNVIPGDVLPKDPVVTVKADSEKCYVYVLITNELGNAATYNINTDTSTDNYWIEVLETGDSILYRYNKVVDATSTAVYCAVFTELTFATDLDKDAVAGLAGKDVIIQAYAHQAENLGNAPITVADGAAKTWMTNAIPTTD